MSVNETVNPIVVQEAASAPTAELMARVAGAELQIRQLRADAASANERASKADARAATAEQELQDLRADVTERFRSMEAAIALLTENA